MKTLHNAHSRPGMRKNQHDTNRRTWLLYYALKIRDATRLPLITCDTRIHCLSVMRAEPISHHGLCNAKNGAHSSFYDSVKTRRVGRTREGEFKYGH